ncbi:hypothetical protein NA56DRAFT_697488 [Hyaloscypha hepaticicola]|uniref:Uncharacterized protein n=1 Tax=Hyaloscypha hepaticicola TaxID=2082293 RepID=A0A2J6QM04_9HELO|nr:hypothetical protein NA56DRAFT_697488 [Hyaloscypha hepaticicola]
MENAEKRKAQHAQPILLCRQSKRPPRKKGRRRMEAGEDEGRKENRRRGAGGAWTTDVSRQSTRGSEVGERRANQPTTVQAQLIHNDESQEESLAGKKAQRHVGLAIGCGSTGCKQQTLQPPKRHGTTPHQSPDGAVAHQPNHDWPLRHGYQRLKLPSRTLVQLSCKATLETASSAVLPLGSRISNMTDGKDPGEQPGLLIARI